jgi:hypothetical protein
MLPYFMLAYGHAVVGCKDKCGYVLSSYITFMSYLTPLKKFAATNNTTVPA